MTAQTWPDDAPEEHEPSVITLSDVATEQVRWVWPGRIPAGKLIILDGDPSVGKSTVTLDWAARVSTGSPWPDGAPCTAGDVLLLTAEDGLADTVAPRLAAAGGNPTRVHVLTETVVPDRDGTPRRVPPSLPRDISTIQRLVTDRGVRLMLVDPFMAYLPGAVDSHRDQDVRGVLHALATMADRTGCAVVLIRHLNKAGGGHALYRGGGSVGIVAAARAALLIARDPDDPTGARRVMAITKSNLAAEPPALAYQLVGDPDRGCARVEWEPDPTSHTAGELLRTGPADEDGRSETREWLVGYLTDQGGEAAANDVLRAGAAHGYTRDMLHRAKRAAGVEAAKSSMGGGWVWRFSAVSPPAESSPRVTDGVARCPKVARRSPEGSEDSGPQGPATFATFGEPLLPSAARDVTVRDGEGGAFSLPPATPADGPAAVADAADSPGWEAAAQGEPLPYPDPDPDQPLDAGPPCETCGDPIGPLRQHLAYGNCAGCYRASTR